MLLVVAWGVQLIKGMLQTADEIWTFWCQKTPWGGDLSKSGGKKKSDGMAESLIQLSKRSESAQQLFIPKID